MTEPVWASSDPARGQASRLGRWVAAATAVVGLVALTIAVTTPPRSGPYCRSGCVTYPYTDVAEFVPRDYLWLYPGLLLILLFVVLTACIHAYATSDKKLFARTGEMFAVIAATAIVVDYGVQLTVMQPGLLKDETDGLSPLSQYNPHGVFIALENVGYLMMAIAFLFIGVAFNGRSGLERATRSVFLGGGAIALGALILLSFRYGAELDYRFEVFGLFIDWLVLIVSGILLSLLFARSPLRKRGTPYERAGSAVRWANTVRPLVRLIVAPRRWRSPRRGP